MQFADRLATRVSPNRHREIEFSETLVLSTYPYFSTDYQNVNTKVRIHANMNPESKIEKSATLKNLIEAAGITQRQLSKETGIAEVTINSWVAGRKVPRLDNAILIASRLGISLKTLSKAMGIDTSKVPDDLLTEAKN